MGNISPVGSFTCQTTDFNQKPTTANVLVGTRGATINFADSDAPSVNYKQHMSNVGAGEPPPEEVHLATLTINGLPFNNADQRASAVEAARKVLGECRAQAREKHESQLAAHLERYENAATPGTKLTPPPPTGVMAALRDPHAFGARVSDVMARLGGKQR